jgi:hypothetical protein
MGMKHENILSQVLPGIFQQTRVSGRFKSSSRIVGRSKHRLGKSAYYHPNPVQIHIRPETDTYIDSVRGGCNVQG